MKRTKGIKTSSNGKDKRVMSAATQSEVMDLLSRTKLGRRLGWQYGDDRKIYDALGYPTEKDLTFTYYFNKYDRQDIATAIIDRPVDATWNGDLTVIEEDTQEDDSKLSKAWKKLDKELKVKKTLNKLDKLAGIGSFSLLLFGFNDVKESKDWKNPAEGAKKLKYLRQFAQDSVAINTWETDSSNERFGLPLTYKIQIAKVGEETSFNELVVHHSRTLHIVDNNLLGEVSGTPRLKPVINRLADLEKLLGGSAEMYWRGARPGYHAAAQEGYEMSTDEEEQLLTELDNYEHDLRRFISATGVDIKSLESQVADPLNHIDAQLQAVSAQTGIPKRVLIGSERGELSSSQDRDAWLSLIQTRMTEFAEPIIYRPFIDKCMSHDILPKTEDYNVMWEDVFAPSEADKVEVGAKRATSLKTYTDSPMAAEVLPPSLVGKYLLGLNEEQFEEVMQAAEEESLLEDEDDLIDEAEGIEVSEEGVTRRRTK